MYTVTGSGENMWQARDAFHFVWKQASGDLAVTADVSFPAAGTEPHRKACVMIRQSLDAGSAYVDAALHGDGLTSLQFREAQGAATHEVQANVSAPKRLRIEKRGKYVLEQILGTPPPPPPPDVPALSEKRRDMEAASMRKRLEAHSDQAVA